MPVINQKTCGLSRFFTLHKGFLHTVLWPNRQGTPSLIKWIRHVHTDSGILKSCCSREAVKWQFKATESFRMRSVPLSSAGINPVSIFLDQGLPPKTKQKRDCVTGREKAIPLPSYHTSLSQGDLLHMNYVENGAEISQWNPDPVDIWALCAMGWLIPGLLLPCPASAHSREPGPGMWAARPWTTHHPELGSDQCWEQQSEREKHIEVSVPKSGIFRGGKE